MRLLAGSNGGTLEPPACLGSQRTQLILFAQPFARHPGLLNDRLHLSYPHITHGWHEGACAHDGRRTHATRARHGVRRRRALGGRRRKANLEFCWPSKTQLWVWDIGRGVL